jgi:hypothetical protein
MLSGRLAKLGLVLVPGPLGGLEPALLPFRLIGLHGSVGIVSYSLSCATGLKRAGKGLAWGAICVCGFCRQLHCKAFTRPARRLETGFAGWFCAMPGLWGLFSASMVQNPLL